jgi:hypothetical protein
VSRRVGISLLARCVLWWVEGPGAVVVDLDRVPAVGHEMVIVGADPAEHVVAGGVVLGVFLDVMPLQMLG